MPSKAIMYLDEIEAGTDGIAQHGKDNSEVVPPESVDDPDPGKDAQEEDQDHEDEEKGRKDVDGVAPVAFIRSPHI